MDKNQHENDICGICKQPLETHFCKLTIEQPKMDRTINTKIYNICHDCMWKLKMYFWDEKARE